MMHTLPTLRTWRRSATKSEAWLALGGRSGNSQSMSIPGIKSAGIANKLSNHISNFTYRQSHNFEEFSQPTVKNSVYGFLWRLLR